MKKIKKFAGVGYIKLFENFDINLDDQWKFGTITLDGTPENVAFKPYKGSKLDVYQEMIYHAPDFVTVRLFIKGKDYASVLRLGNPDRPPKDLEIVIKDIDITKFESYEMVDTDDVLAYVNKEAKLPTIEEIDSKINDKGDVIKLLWTNGLFAGANTAGPGSAPIYIQSKEAHEKYKRNKNQFIKNELKKWGFYK